MDEHLGNAVEKPTLQSDHGIQKASPQKTNSPAQYCDLHPGN